MLMVWTYPEKWKIWIKWYLLTQLIFLCASHIDLLKGQNRFYYFFSYKNRLNWKQPTSILHHIIQKDSISTIWSQVLYKGKLRASFLLENLIDDNMLVKISPFWISNSKLNFQVEKKCVLNYHALEIIENEKQKKKWNPKIMFLQSFFIALNFTMDYLFLVSRMVNNF